MRKQILISLLCLVIGMMQGGVLLAGELPEDPPVIYSVDRVDMQERVIVLNDSYAEVADYVIVRNANGAVVSKNSVKRGDMVAVVFSLTNGNERPLVTEINILPK